jgi:1,4-dihydroxy-2-naphthoyl-CoA hydrolase
VSTTPNPRALIEMMPFAVHCGVEVVSAEAEKVEGRMAWSAQRCTAGGVLHGGALMTLADTLGAVCAFLNLPQGASTTTIESKTNFFRAVRSGDVRATTTPLHIGRRVIVVQTDLRDDRDKLVAQITQTQAVLTE